MLVTNEGEKCWWQVWDEKFWDIMGCWWQWDEKVLPLILCSLSRCRTKVVCFIGNIFVLSSCDLNLNSSISWLFLTPNDPKWRHSTPISLIVVYLKWPLLTLFWNNYRKLLRNFRKIDHFWPIGFLFLKNGILNRRRILSDHNYKTDDPI